MLLDKSGKLVKALDFRGTKIEFLDKISAKDLFNIITAALEVVNTMLTFKARDLAPKQWGRTPFEPILKACVDDTGATTEESRRHALRLFGVIIKQALIMTPLLFRQEGDNGFEGTTYIRESLVS